MRPLMIDVRLPVAPTSATTRLRNQGRMEKSEWQIANSEYGIANGE
jgi:hypothetical protein